MVSWSGNRSDARGYVVETGCPGCGGVVKLKHGFGTTRCDFCGSLLRIGLPATVPAYVARERISKFEVRPHLDRYLKANDKPLSTFELEIKGVYIPYWSVDGLLLKLREQKEVKVLVEQNGYARDERTLEQQHARVSLVPHSTSVCAIADAVTAPASLGVRTAGLVLRPMVEENINNEFELFSPQITSEGAVAKVEQQVANLNRLAGLGSRKSVSKFFGHGIELVQVPYYVCVSTDEDGSVAYLLDAVTGRVESEFRDLDWIENAASIGSDQEYGELSLSLHRCGNCGEDLPDSNGLVVICGNCNVLTALDPSVPRDLQILTVASDESTADFSLPFWVFELPECERARLRMAFGTLEEFGSAVVPAFEIRNSEALHRTILRASASYQQIEPAGLEQRENYHYPATEPVGYSAGLLQASYLRAQLERTNHLTEGDCLSLGRLRALQYLPFKAESYFLVDTQLGAITIERAALTHAAKLDS